MCSHSRFDLFKTHYLPRCSRAWSGRAYEGSILARCLSWLRAPNIGLRLDFRDETWVLVSLVASSLRCLELGLVVLLCRTLTVPQIVSHLLLSYNIRNLGGIAKEIKIPAYWGLSFGVAFEISAEGVVIEVVVGFFKLVTEPIVGVFEIDTSRRHCQLNPHLTSLWANVHIIIIILVLEGLQLSSLRNTGKWILVLKDTLTGPRGWPIAQPAASIEWEE